ncbi:MAG: sce7726 family protein [Prolixibacteraceae bacterium]
MNRLNDANNIKALLIDFLIDNNQDVDFLFGSEVFFGKKKRQTDIITVNGTITAYEIKASNDDFRRVREQLDDYKKVFDYQYLVVTEEHEKKATSFLKKNEGLIVIDRNLNVMICKKASLIKKQSKAEILETIPLSFLKMQYRLPSDLNAFNCRNILLKRRLPELKITLKNFLESRLRPRNDLFKSEKGVSTHFEDIKLLSRQALQLD